MVRSEYAANQEMERGATPTTTWKKPALVRTRTRKCWLRRLLGI
jgi:hypothetical protein